MKLIDFGMSTTNRVCKKEASLGTVLRGTCGTCGTCGTQCDTIPHLTEVRGKQSYQAYVRSCTMHVLYVWVRLVRLVRLVRPGTFGYAVAVPIGGSGDARRCRIRCLFGG